MEIRHRCFKSALFQRHARLSRTNIVGRYASVHVRLYRAPALPPSEAVLVRDTFPRALKRRVRRGTSASNERAAGGGPDLHHDFRCKTSDCTTLLFLHACPWAVVRATRARALRNIFKPEREDIQTKRENNQTTWDCIIILRLPMPALLPHQSRNKQAISAQWIRGAMWSIKLTTLFGNYQRRCFRLINTQRPKGNTQPVRRQRAARARASRKGCC
jgi:hypothetical protein